MDDMMVHWDTVTAHDVAEVAAEDLIPTGTYEGLVTKITTQVVDREDNPYFGEPVARITVELYDVEGRTRNHFFGASPTKRLNEKGKNRSEYKHGVWLTKALDMVGRPFGEVLDAAPNKRLRFSFRQLPPRDGFEPSNFMTSIRSI